MSSCKVENLSQVANAILPGPKGPGFLAVISVNQNQVIDQNSINPSDASYKSVPTLLESLKRMAKTYP